MEKQLSNNFDFIQKQIDQIKQTYRLDIKEISDLQRFVEMQKNIVHALHLIRGGQR